MSEPQGANESGPMPKRGFAAYGRAAAVMAAVILIGGGVRAAIHRPAPPPPTPLTATPVEAAPTGEPPPEIPEELQMRIAAALVPEGDAPGTDSKVVPRPTGATRLLDSSLDANGSRIRVYSTKQPMDAVVAELTRGAVASGFAARDVKVDPGTAVFGRGDEYVVLRFSTREDRVLVSIVEFGFRRASASGGEGQP